MKRSFKKIIVLVLIIILILFIKYSGAGNYFTLESLKSNKDKLVRFNYEISKNGHLYLLTMRLNPVFPYFLVNILAALTAIPFITFIWTTFVGILPGSLIYAFAGSQLNTISSLKDIFSLKILFALSLLFFIPLFLRRNIKPDV